MSSLLQGIALHAGGHTAWSDGWSGPWWLFFPLIWIILVATIVWLALRGRRHSRGTPLDSAVEILASRFARGEIDAAEYRERLDEIRGLS